MIRAVTVKELAGLCDYASKQIIKCLLSRGPFKHVVTLVALTKMIKTTLN